MPNHNAFTQIKKNDVTFAVFNHKQLFIHSLFDGKIVKQESHKKIFFFKTIH